LVNVDRMLERHNNSVSDKEGMKDKKQ